MKEAKENALQRYKHLKDAKDGFIDRPKYDESKGRIVYTPGYIGEEKIAPSVAKMNILAKSTFVYAHLAIVSRRWCYFFLSKIG